MSNRNNSLTGFIYNDNRKINFYLDGYIATFVNTDFCKIQFDLPFIYGQTHDFHNLAIYKGDSPISLSYTKKINIPAYIVAADNALATDWESFDYITFSGGILNSLFFCRALKREYTDNSKILFHRQDDSISWEFETEDCICELSVSSKISESFGVHGTTISNDRVVLLLKFSKSQPLESVFKYIQKIKDALSFMAYRKNISFENIHLHHNDRSISKMQVFLREDIPIEVKDIMNCITFHDLRDSIPALFSIVFNSQDNRPSYEFGFIPTSSKDTCIINNQKVRLICSALECESSFFEGLYPEEEEHLHNLIHTIKKTIKEHRKSSEKLSGRTYDLIFSNIRNWSMSATDKICALFHRYDEAMTLLNPSDLNIGDEEIHNFVKYRNSITHGSYKILNGEIAATAYVLQGLIYCCLLTRIGMSEDEILQLCKNRKILS